MSMMPSPRRICFLSPHSDPLGRIGDPDTGGQSIYERELARALTGLAPEIEVDVYTRWYAPKPRIESLGERAQVIRIPVGGDGFIRKEDLAPHLPAFARQVEEYAREHSRGYEVVHAHYWDGGATALLTQPRWQLPLVFTSHSLGKLKQRDLPDEETYHYSIRIPQEIAAMRAAQRIIALSRVELGYLEDLYGVEASKVAIVPGGVDVTFFAPRGEPLALRHALGIPGDDAELLVLALGRLDPRKGFPQLMHIAAEVIRRVEVAGRSVRFFISAGGHEPLSTEEQAEQGRILEAIAAEGIERQITLVPKLDLSRVPEYYTASDVFAVPSPYEPFGLVIVEAMACGAPVVATDQGGPVDIIAEGVDGYLANPQQTEAFAGRICEVLLDDDLRARMRTNARIKAVNTYSWDAIARQALAVYDEAIQAGRSARAAGTSAV